MTLSSLRCFAFKKIIYGAICRHPNKSMGFINAVVTRREINFNLNVCKVS